MADNRTASATGERVSIPVIGAGAVAATLRLPAEPAVAAVTIHPATAVGAWLYTSFAEYLVGHGFAVLTYDYRGTGASGTPRANRGLKMRDWMYQDVPAVAAWMAERLPQIPHFAVGHSVGGQALALNNGTKGLQGFVSIASHAGVTRAIEDRKERLRVGLILRVVGPAFSVAMGMVPGRRLGIGEDIPGAVMLEWSKWSRLPFYFFDDPSLGAAESAAKVNTDVLAIGFTDDLWATPRQIDALFSRLPSASLERRTYSPEDGGVPAIGHLGFFRRAGKALWPPVLEWLEARTVSVLNGSSLGIPRRYRVR
ncbi:alpha/beta hydrolase family protein [Ruicaihuangia caeni]|uniref:alpha/beta hydrolase family protein n=1 Tax=Ruicaihuangia caeni TaxID=3042517 RepID=UPI00338FA092